MSRLPPLDSNHCELLLQQAGLQGLPQLLQAAQQLSLQEDQRHPAEVRHVMFILSLVYVSTKKLVAYLQNCETPLSGATACISLDIVISPAA